MDPALFAVDGQGHLSVTVHLYLAGPKRLQLIHEMVPIATVYVALVNPTSPNLAAIQSRDLQPAALVLGLKVQVLEAGTERDLETVFTQMGQFGGRRRSS